MNCSCGQRSHKNQIKKYPAGVRVVAISEISNGGDGPDLPFGSTGKITAHCDDGRAWVVFDADDSAHTFHFPEQNIAAEFRPKSKKNGARK